jgi:hypothetical protein
LRKLLNHPHIKGGAVVNKPAIDMIEEGDMKMSINFKLKVFGKIIDKNVKQERSKCLSLACLTTFVQ